MAQYLRDVLNERQKGILSGVPSFCTANDTVLRALIRNAKKKNRKILIEATSNQVNQDLGYTGMNPFDFTNYLNTICDEFDFPRTDVIKGGDHLGPLPWSDLPAAEAMDKAEVLVRMCVQAGFKKIHLDATMKLGDDPDECLSDEVIATRSARLYKACEEEYSKMKVINPQEAHPVFVIGSEVPYAGGIRSNSESVLVTDPKDLEKTIQVFHKVFDEEKIEGAWKNIIAIVVQPGVDFGSNRLQQYDRSKSEVLCNELKKYPRLVFEGHSTDFQPKECLKQMVEDGIAILKVGPALTFALREALFSLSFIEDYYYGENERSNFRKVIDEIMVSDPKYWNKYYFGSEHDKAIQRHYGLSDRCRYYYADATVNAAAKKLVENVSTIDLPLGLIHQFLPNQYEKIVTGRLNPDVDSLICDHIIDVVRNYEYATDFRYVSD